MNGKYYVLYDVLSDYSVERVSGKSEYGDFEHAKKRARKDNRGGAITWHTDSRYRFKGKPAKAWKGFNKQRELINLIVEVNKKSWRDLVGKSFDMPKTKAMKKFLDKEAPNRVTGLSIEPDGVFIYTNSNEWSDDSGSGTFREDSETLAIKSFYELVQPSVYKGNPMANEKAKNPVTEKRKGNPIKRFTKKHIATLKREYAKIDKIDPASPSYTRMIFLLDGLPQGALKQLANANIKFVSALAKNRIVKGNKNPKPFIPKKFEHEKFRNSIKHFLKAAEFEKQSREIADAALTKYGDHGPLISGIIRDHFPDITKKTLRKLRDFKNYAVDMGFAAKPPRVHDKTMRELYQSIMSETRSKNPVTKKKRSKKKRSAKQLANDKRLGAMAKKRGKKKAARKKNPVTGTKPKGFIVASFAPVYNEVVYALDNKGARMDFRKTNAKVWKTQNGASAAAVDIASNWGEPCIVAPINASVKQIESYFPSVKKSGK